MLRIALDARNLTRPLSGIARSIVSVLEALSDCQIDTDLIAPAMLHSNFNALKDRPNLCARNDEVYGYVGRLIWGRHHLPQHVSKIKPDIFWAPAHRLSSRVARLAPTVLTVHDMVWKYAPETMPLHRRYGDRFLTQHAVQSATRIVAVSKRTAHDLALQFPGVAPKIRVVHNMVSTRPEPTQESCLRQLGIDGPYCLFVGTIEPRKNLVRSVKAFLRIPKQIRGDTRFVVVGARGWLTGEIDKVLCDAGDDVLTTGKVDEATLSCLYRNCLFLAVPSIYEGFGYPVIEAQQFGKRVLTSKGSSMAEIGGDTVVTVDPLDIQSIGDGMRRCLTEDSRSYSRRAMSNAARFQPEIVLPQLLAVFEEARQDWKG